MRDRQKEGDRKLPPQREWQKEREKGDREEKKKQKKACNNDDLQALSWNIKEKEKAEVMVKDVSCAVLRQHTPLKETF